MDTYICNKTDYHYKVVELEKRIAELEAELKAYELRDKMHPLPIADCGGCRKRDERIAELEEKCEKFRAALQAISYRGNYGGDLCSCWKVARNTLEKR